MHSVASNTGLFEIPSDDEDIIDLPMVKTDIVKKLEEKKQDEIKERENKFTTFGIWYALCLVTVIVTLNIGIYYSLPYCDDDCDDSSSSSDEDVSSKPTPFVTYYPTSTMTMEPTSHPHNTQSPSETTPIPTSSNTQSPTQQRMPISSSTQSPTQQTNTPTISPNAIITDIPTTSPIITSNNPTSVTSYSHIHFYCGTTEEDAKACQYSCLVDPCPMFEYCFEVSTCTSFL